MDLFLTADLRGETEGRRPMEVDPPSAPQGEQEPERKKVISVDIDESDDEGGVRGGYLTRLRASARHDDE